jgi:flavin reductase (DIM6/NTAB) family NADH-FMN oxidoreductase RutF
MGKIVVPFMKYAEITTKTMVSDGLLLASLDASAKPNAMAIGWGTIGAIWGKPMFIVLVRPSRYTYECIEATGDFTVNVGARELKEIVAYCGTVSGRDVDKFEEKSLTAVKGTKVKSPIIEECIINYECKVVHKNDVIPERLTDEITMSAYPGGDFHRVYFGEIVATFADDELDKR